jgi:hypothetical protein
MPTPLEWDKAKKKKKIETYLQKEVVVFKCRELGH